MKANSVLILSACCLLTSCMATNKQERVVVTGSSLPYALPLGGPTSFPRVATREYLNTRQPAQRGYGAYAYLVFTSDPRSAQKKRYMEMCAAFHEFLPPSAASASAAERRAQMVTFWPLQRDPVGEDPDCHQLIVDYDRAFAARIAASTQKEDARGPLLIAWTKPFLYGETSSDALVLDMSTFSNNDLARAIRIWKGRIALDPTIWQHGWKAVVVKEEFRNVIENIAPDVVTVVATFFRKPKSE